MNRQKYCDYIAEKIAVLSYQIKVNGKLNLLHLNIHAETLYRDFLNHLLDYTLESANVGKANYEAIDLIDHARKIVVQVTSTVTVEKINSTLKKDKIKELSSQGYQLRFIFIADEANKLRAKDFNNVHGICFDPAIDILDKAILLEEVTQLPIDKLAILYDFIRKEFGEKPNSKRISSNLASIVNILAKEDLESLPEKLQLNDYGIEEKIDFNDLMDIKESTFDEYKVYYGVLDRIYATFIQEGTNKVSSILRKLTSLYEKELLITSTNVEKIFNIIEKAEQQVLEYDVVEEIPEEEIDMCVRIIVVDAFIRCKIFKNPRGYTYVTS